MVRVSDDAQAKSVGDVLGGTIAEGRDGLQLGGAANGDRCLRRNDGYGSQLRCRSCRLAPALGSARTMVSVPVTAELTFAAG